MSLGQKGSGDPGAMLTSLLNKREKLRQDLRSIEKQVYELETSYLQESSHIGNALKGFEGFLSSSKSTASAKRSRKFQPEDRVFSLSSVTSPALVEIVLKNLVLGEKVNRATSTKLTSLLLFMDQFRHLQLLDVIDGRAELGPGRSKGGLSTGQGKPKKGRGHGVARDAKRNRPSEPDYDDEDDPDASMYVPGSLI
ncbi:hypothetical protein HID58_014525 [Brassica napus]|uniref:Chromatin modification-related protein MEAF6 n=1 Tax=Brassica napus TaxID=3708 RepID=A0ABQ8DHH9_BRANA|nr:hypothetical protein HID58_014525 [Brassica napus]